MKSTYFRYTRLDKWTAALLAVIVMAVCLLGLDRGHEWGDDFAAYMTQGIAISEGRFDEQIALNDRMHPSERSFGGRETEEELVYVWGLPLLLAGVYRLVGYDQPLGEMILYYKIPGVLCFAAFAAALFLFYRRRFSYPVSVFLTSLLALNVPLLGETNLIMTDIPCLAAGMAALLLMEIFADAKSAAGKWISGALMALSMWFCYVVRLNGVTVVAIAALGHVLTLIKRRERLSALPVHALPYLGFALLMLLSGLFFPEATSNTDHIASGPNAWILHNIKFYDGLIRDWVCSMLPDGMPLAGYVHYALYLLIAVGVLKNGIRENFHLTALVAGTYAVVYLLPYVQSLRYIFNILPAMLMFAAYGAQAMGGALMRKTNHARARRTLCAVGAVVLAGIFCSNLYQTADRTMEQMGRGGASYRYGAYEQGALEMYAYIHENTPQDAMIGFVKPRALYLNTGRVSFIPGLNGNLFKEADYLLLTKPYDMITDAIWPELWQEMTLEYENGMMQLYRLSEAYKNAP